MKTVEESRRALFEAQMDALDKNPGQWLNGDYQNVYGRCAWIGFNAALDAVEIDLSGVDEYDGWQAVDSCRAAIESTNLGLKIR